MKLHKWDEVKKRSRRRRTHVPNEATIKALNEATQYNLPTFSTVDELIGDLNAEDESEV